MKRSLIMLALLSMAVFIAASSPQIVPPSDPNYVRTEVWSNSQLQYVEFLFNDSGTIIYEAQNSTGIILESRPATSIEIERYLQAQTNIAISDATTSLNSNPEPGTNYGQWVVDRSAELLMCETNMSNGQLMDFESLGVNGKNSTIREIERCVELNANVTRKIIKNLCDVLTVQEIIICIPD